MDETKQSDALEPMPAETDTTPPLPEDVPAPPVADGDESGEPDAISEADRDTDELEWEPAKTRPIASKMAEPVAVESEPRLLSARRCHVGARRERNEDSCLLFVAQAGGHFAASPFGLFIVADGMGGHSDGHVASNIASRVAGAHILQNLYLPLLQDEAAMKQPIQEVLEQAVQKANKAVFEYDAEMDSGTTLTIAVVMGRRLYVAHVGDSRLYLWANGRLEPITSDHSLVQRLQDVGQLTAEEATFYRYGHILLKAVGQAEEVEADVYMRLLPKSGKLLLCSDGLSGFVSAQEIQMILDQNAPLQQMVDELFEAAMDMGGFDNITAVLVDFDL